MIYVITQDCEIANKAYKPGDEIDEKDTPFFASVMKKVDKVAPIKAKAEDEAKSANKVLTKKEMVDEIDKITPLTKEQKEALMGKKVPELTAEMEKVKAEAKAKAEDEAKAKAEDEAKSAE